MSPENKMLQISAATLAYDQGYDSVYAPDDQTNVPLSLDAFEAQIQSTNRSQPPETPIDSTTEPRLANL